MDMTEPVFWIIGTYLAVGIVLLLATLRPNAHENVVLRLQTSVGVDLPHGIGEQLRRRFALNRRSQLVGGMVGVVLSAAIIGWTVPDPDAVHGMMIAAGAFAGPALAVSITTLLTSGKPEDDRPRYARAHAVGLGDYIPTLERWLARGPVLLAVLCFVGWAFAIGMDLHPARNVALLASGGGLALLSAASLFVFEYFGRRIVSMGNWATSPEELVWEDALRSHTVRDIASAPSLVGLYAILVGLAPTFDPSAESRFFGWAGLAAVGVLLLLLLVTVILRPERHFLRRLWPELAATTGKPYGAEAEV